MGAHINSTLQRLAAKPPIKFINLMLIPAIGIWILISATPIGQLEIRIAVKSSQPGISQIFSIDELGRVTEENSHYVPVSTGENFLNFPITPIMPMETSTFRWDPLDTPASMQVHFAEVKGLFLQKEIDLDTFQAQVDVIDPQVVKGSLEFQTGSNDAQMTVSSEAVKLYGLNLLQNAAVALLCGSIFALIWIASFNFRARWRGAPVRKVQVLAPTLPWWLSVGAGAVLAINIAMLVLGSQRIGAMWDGRSIADRTLAYLLGGWFIEKYGFDEGLSSMGDTFVYAPLNGLLPHVVSVLAGNESWVEISHSAATYASRNLAIAGLSLVGTIAVALTARLLLSSWKWALLSAAVVTSIPAWTGQGMFNVKDVPVAAGYTVFTLSLVLMTRVPSHSRWIFPIFAASFIGGSVLAVGTRPGMWVPLALSASLVLIALSLTEFKREGPIAFRVMTYRLAVVGTFFVLDYAILLVLYPRAFTTFTDILIESASASASYPIDIPTLTAGEIIMSSNTPWFYLPKWLGAQTPLLIGISIIVALVFGSVKVVQRSRSDSWDNLVSWVPVALQAAMMPIAIVILGSAVFNGTRHFIFVYPALALMATVGFALVLSRLRGQKIGRLSIFVAIAIAIVIPTINQLRLFPYNFIYVNPIAAAGGVSNNWELDFQGVSAREVVANSDYYSFVTCDDEVLSINTSCEDDASVAPYLTGYVQRGSGEQGNEERILLFHQNSYGTPMNPDCIEVSQVQRWLFDQELSLFSAYDCPRNPDRAFE